jgi:large subunit ribosomal protein L11
MNSVESGPPLSTILGNFGINSVKLCKDFNEFSKELPIYFVLEVIIIIYNDKTYIFEIKQPTTSLLLKLVAKQHSIFIKGSGGLKVKKIKVVSTRDIYLISQFKFNSIEDNYLRMVYGTLVSMQLYVIS